jgi:predicted amino acid-binding ACT domain protein
MTWAQNRRGVGRNTTDAFPVKIVVHTDDRPGLLAQLTSVLSSENTNIRSLEARTEVNAADGALVEMTVDVRDKKQLEKLVAAMRRISGIGTWSVFSIEMVITDPEHIAISKSKGITIDWKDGHASTYALDYLRENCPCRHVHQRARNAPPPSPHPRHSRCISPPSR